MNQLFLREAHSRESHEIRPPCVIGRGPDADLVLSDPAISHRHALIDLAEGEFTIQDLKSTNGVFLNERLVMERAPLKPGDSIRLGHTVLLASQEIEEAEPSETTIILNARGPISALELDHQRLRLITEITPELADNKNLIELGGKLFARFKEVFNQDRGYLALLQQDGSLLSILLDSSPGAPPLSRSIIDRVLHNREALLLEDALDDASFQDQESILGLRIRSALCVPLTCHEDVYGLIYLDRNMPGFYKQDDLEFLRTIALIIAPLIENARLWSELKNRYAQAVETLNETQARLIEMERDAAYVSLAQAMAHEIRNPLMVIGGMVKRIARTGADNLQDQRFQAVLAAVERVETVLKEVDDFVKISEPRKKLERIDLIIREEIEAHSEGWLKKALRPVFSVATSRVMIPLDCDLFRKALSMVFKEVFEGAPGGTEVQMVLVDSDEGIEIRFGGIDREARLCEPSHADLHGKPWSFGLFLNIAKKIISDHGGKLLVDSRAHSAFPILVRMPGGANLMDERRATLPDAPFQLQEDNLAASGEAYHPAKNSTQI